MSKASFDIRTVEDFRYVDEGPPTDLPPIVLLHGMLGDIDNWTSTIQALVAHQYRVIVPILPVYEMPMSKTSVQGLVDHVRAFLDVLHRDPVVLIGNSLGGHIALKYALQYPADVEALILTGSSGIYEMEMGSSTMRRRDREFIRERAALTFYDPVHATDELVDEMFEIVNDRGRALRLIKMARSAQADTVTDELSEIRMPTLLVWGRDDAITPPDVAQVFRHRMPQATLSFIDHCGHAPMIEHPATFNEITLEFLRQQVGVVSLETTRDTS